MSYSVDPCGCLSEAVNGRLVHPCPEHSFFCHTPRTPLTEAQKEQFANILAQFLIEGAKDIRT